MRRAAADTNALTTPATMTNTINATRFSASAIVHLWMGGVNSRFTTRNAASAETIAGTTPPSAATTTTSSR